MKPQSALIEDAQSWHLLRNMLDILNLHRTLRGLRESGTSATLARLFVSKHVRDLKLIGGAAAWLMLLGVLASFLLHIFSGNPIDIEKLITSVGVLVSIGGAVLAWVYRTASIRLGVVD